LAPAKTLELKGFLDFKIFAARNFKGDDLSITGNPPDVRQHVGEFPPRFGPHAALF
jgi:hypothetical protein